MASPLDFKMNRGKFKLFADEIPSEPGDFITVTGFTGGFEEIFRHEK
jgi:hypothetical protein